MSLVEPVTANPLTFYWLIVTTFFETGLGIAAYLLYTQIIPFFKTRAYMTILEAPMEVKNPFYRLIVGRRIRKIPNRWWIRLLFLRGLSFVVIFTVLLNVVLSVGWASPFEDVTRNGLTSPGWLYNLVYSRSTNEPNSAHLVSFIGIPVLALYAMWKYKDEFIGPTIGAFFVAVHEGPWVIAYYAIYWPYLSLNQLTNVLKDVSFMSMIILFILAFTRYKSRKIRLEAFNWPIRIYLIALALWIVVPYFFGYGFLPITTINNWEYGKGIYSVTEWWASPLVNGIEVGSWFGLFLMMTFVVWRDKRVQVSKV